MRHFIGLMSRTHRPECIPARFVGSAMAESREPTHSEDSLVLAAPMEEDSVEVASTEEASTAAGATAAEATDNLLEVIQL